MPDKRPPDFSKDEVRDTRKARDGIEIQLADAEMPLCLIVDREKGDYQDMNHFDYRRDQSVAIVNGGMTICPNVSSACYTPRPAVS